MQKWEVYKVGPSGIPRNAQGHSRHLDNSMSEQSGQREHSGLQQWELWVLTELKREHLKWFPTALSQLHQELKRLLLFS